MLFLKIGYKYDLKNAEILQFGSRQEIVELLYAHNNALNYRK